MGTPRNSGPRSGRVLQKRARNEQVFAMRISGASLAQIAAYFHITRRRVQQLFDEEEVRRAPQYAASIEKLRNQAIERLDRLALAHWQRHTDPASAAILLRIEERRSALLGTDAPIESRVEYAPPRPPQEVDLSRLSDEDVRALHRIMLKAQSEPNSDAPLLIEHHPTGDTDEST